jgi:hypothetical protein
MKFGDIYTDRRDAEVVMALGVDNPNFPGDPEPWPLVLVLTEGTMEDVGDISDRPLMDAVEWKLIE